LGLSDAEFEAMVFPDTLLPPDLSSNEIREACRSLKGSVLRREIYALDSSDAADRPYSVTESNYTIKLLQPLGPNQHAVFLTHSREIVDFRYERKLYDVAGMQLADPRVSHAMVLEVNEYGNPLKSVSIGYGRRHDDPDPLLTADDRNEQRRLLATYTENNYTNPILQDDDYRVPLPSETHTYELVRIAPTSNLPNITNLFGFDEMTDVATAASDGSHDLPYEDVSAVGASENHPYRRLIEQNYVLYRRDDLTGPLGNGQLESRALPFESYKLAFTESLVQQVFGGRVTDDMLSGDDGTGGQPSNEVSGYVRDQAGWWIPSGKVFYSSDPNDTPAQELAFARKRFFLPHRYEDPFGNKTTVSYDAHKLLLLETEDALQNKVTAGERNDLGQITPKIDYRVLQPTLITDPNLNQSKVVFDALGLVVGTAVMGKSNEQKGDLLDDAFLVDLDQGAIEAFFNANDSIAQAPGLLQQAGTRIIYDLDRYQTTAASNAPQPSSVATLARETHVSDLVPLKIQVRFSYSDGFGREIQKKIQAEPGQLVKNGPIVSRWVGSGWTIFNNKGKPIRKYEPFFSATHAFEFANTKGVSPILFYDPVERVIATAHPNHSWEKVVFDPWRQETWDVNDTALLDPTADQDVEDFFNRLPSEDYKPSWYALRTDPTFAADFTNLFQDQAIRQAETDAATKTANHAGTATLVFFDSLGRTFLSVADNGAGGKYATRSQLDIEGKQRAVIDAKNRVVMRYDYDISGNRLHQISMEAGERWMLNDVCGKTIRAWDSRGHSFSTDYDALRRPTQSFVQGVEQQPLAKIMFNKTEYGEGQPDKLNLRTRPFRVSDSVGVVTNEEYDFKGNLLRTRRQLVKDYKVVPDWSTDPALEQETFTNGTTFDALNRAVAITTPDASVIHPVYNAANLLERIDVNLQGAEIATPFLTNIDYNAKGQQELIEYGSGARTNYDYDPMTFRLARLQTLRSATPLQDLTYSYDPVGNITHIEDDAQQTIYFDGQVVEPHGDYAYDATYRLLVAEGREHIGQVPQPWTTWDDKFRIDLAHPNDGQKMQRYTEQYDYDEVGNFVHLIHQANHQGAWTRDYHYNEPSRIEPGKQNNRLSSTSVGNNTETYSYDAHGNMTRMPHLPLIAWDFNDRLQQADLGGGGTAWYMYDASGQRVRKVIERQNGTRQKERIYLRGYERYRDYGGADGNVTLERETLHVMDGQHRVALVETRTQGDDNGLPAQLVRYQFGNQLGSAILELDEAGQIISYEEYYPYGSTAYQAGRTVTEVSLKRYRYTGKERDEETGLYYHGARYYAPWLGRWTAADPIAIEGGINVYAYVRASPINFGDPHGTDVGPKSVEIKEREEREMARSHEQLAPQKSPMLIQGRAGDIDPDRDMKEYRERHPNPYDVMKNDISFIGKAVDPSGIGIVSGGLVRVFGVDPRTAALIDHSLIISSFLGGGPEPATPDIVGRPPVPETIPAAKGTSLEMITLFHGTSDSFKGPIKVGEGTRDDLGAGFYVSTDPNVGDIYAEHRASKPGMGGGAVLKSQIPKYEIDLAKPVDVRPEGAHGQLFQNFLDQPSEYPRLKPGEPLYTYREVLSGKTEYLITELQRGVIFERFLEQNNLQGSGVKIGALGDEVTGGGIDPGYVTNQYAISNPRLLNAIQSNMTWKSK
jgi:RHS repeat-associated protein